MKRNGLPVRRAGAAPASFEPVATIRRRRDGLAHSDEELRALIRGMLDGTVADYQASAWLMAAYFRPLSTRETVALTRAMLSSGVALRRAGGGRPRIDKHSTGGVGDKVSLCLAPLVAAAGVDVPMISGRGLGHTGGTLDKLEAIPGFRTRLPTARVERQVAEHGLAMVGQSDDLAPADRRLYALRDVTATVESIPLIVASILSKKLAASLDGLVLDVKHGRGAFLPSLDDARALCRALIQVGRGAGLRVSALITNMDRPLGRTIGNALETREALEVLHGVGPPDTTELTLELGAEMLLLGGVERHRGRARERLISRLRDGSALARMASLVRAQGGDPRVVREPDRLPRAPAVLVLRAPRRGWVTSVDPRALGLLAVALGAGRTRAEQDVDARVGFVLRAIEGDHVEPGAPLIEVHARSRSEARAHASRVLAAFEFSRRRPEPAPLVTARYGARGRA